MFTTDITEYNNFVCCCPHGIEMYTISIAHLGPFPSILQGTPPSSYFFNYKLLTKHSFYVRLKLAPVRH